MRISKISVVLLVTVVLMNLGGERVSAQLESCGRVIYPVNFYNEGSEEGIYPVTDCSNPFNSDIDPGFTYGLSLAEQSVVDGGEITISAATQVMSGEFFINHPDTATWRALGLFLHQGGDFIAVGTTINDEIVNDTRTESSFTSILSPGMYTAVFTVEHAPLLSSADSWWMKLLSYTAPAAEAFYDDSTAVATITL